MNWEDFVAENEGPELDAARARLRDDDSPMTGVREPRRPLPPDTSAITTLPTQPDENS